MRRKAKMGLSILTSAALALALVPSAAFAATGINNDVDASTNWDVPSYYMDNTVEVDGTLYKVITTWSTTWAISGPDYLGISNSGTLTQFGGSSAIDDLATAQNSTMLGIWASAVNEVPNAFNWNFFYNLALDADGEDTDSTLTAISSSSNSSYDTQSGVWAPFKYRPEVFCWLSGTLNASTLATYVGQINSLTYYVDTSGETSVEGTENEYYIDGDEDYDPYVVDDSGSNTNYRNGNVCQVLDNLYELAGYAESVEKETADYNSDGAITSDNVTWKTMNLLPRTTRYEASSESAMTARECALAAEKLVRGSVYYTLAKIADGTTEKKKVAIIVGTPDTTSSTCTVICYEDSEISQGSTNGKIGFSALTVDQLTTDTVVAESEGYYTTYTATVDELLSCDYIWAGNGSLTVEQVQSWLSTYATTEATQATASTIEILTDTAAYVNAFNFTFEKEISCLLAVCFFYPELWPDLELCTYWYDNVYHVYEDSLGICMLYGLGNATMPSGVEIADLPGDSYSTDDIDAKALEGYEYYVSTLADDETFSSYSNMEPSDTYVSWAEAEIQAAQIATLEEELAEAEAANSELTAQLEEALAALDEATAGSEELQAALDEANQAVADAQAALEEAGSTSSLKANTMTVTVTPKTVKAKKLKKAKKVIKAITVKNAQGTVTYKKGSVKRNGKKATSKVAKKIVVNASTGKITLKKGLKKGTYKVTVKVKASGNSTYAAETNTVTVTVKVK